MPKYLVVAHQTADSAELVAAVGDIARDDPDARFSLVVPATPVEHLFTWTEGETQAVAEAKAELAHKALEAAGARVVEATVGDADPVLAVRDALLREEFDTVVLSTLPLGVSRWIKMDVVHRLERMIDVPVLHVIAESSGS